MSTSLSPRPSGHPTRQQLDELDALLQRMLALPVNQAGDDVTAEIDASPRPAPAPRPAPVSYRTPDYAEDGAPAEDAPAAPAAPPRLDAAHVAGDAEGNADGDNWVPLSSTWKPSPHTWKPLAQSWQQPRFTVPAQEPAAAVEEPVAVAPPVVEPPAPPAPAPVAAPLPPVPAPTDGAPDLSGWRRALVRFNDGFDVLLLPFGTPGRWLRRDGRGRPALGGAGVLLLATAAALALTGWFGWTWHALLDKMR